MTLAGRLFRPVLLWSLGGGVHRDYSEGKDCPVLPWAADVLDPHCRSLQTPPKLVNREYEVHTPKRTFGQPATDFAAKLRKMLVPKHFPDHNNHLLAGTLGSLPVIPERERSRWLHAPTALKFCRHGRYETDRTRLVTAQFSRDPRRVMKSLQSAPLEGDGFETPPTPNDA
jgi:hypothetical protein